MPLPKKVDKEQLWGMFATGLPTKVCAAKFDVAVQVINRYRKVWKRSQVKTLVLHHADQAIQTRLDAEEQMSELSSKAWNLVKLCEDAVNGDEAALVALGVDRPINALLGSQKQVLDVLKQWGEFAKMTTDFREIRLFQDVMVETLKEIGGDDAVKQFYDRLSIRRTA